MKKGIKIVQGNDEHLVIDGDNFMLWSLLHLLDRCGVCVTPTSFLGISLPSVVEF